MAENRYLAAIDTVINNPLKNNDIKKNENLRLADDDEINALCLLKYEQKILRDQQQNIISKLVTVDDEEGKKKLLFVRDARNINDNSIDESYNFAVIGLNYLTAAKRMLLTSPIADKIKAAGIDFIALAKKLITEIHHHHLYPLDQVISDFLYAEIEVKLTTQFPHLFTEEDVHETLEKWAAWASLEMPSPAISTIHSFGNKKHDKEIFIQLDIPQTKLSTAIQNEWEEVISGEKENKNNFDWFKHGLDEKEKIIAKHYAALMIKGDRNPSARLRQKIPGPKNTYQQLVLKHHDISKKDKQKKIKQYHHAELMLKANPYLTPEEKQAEEKKVDYFHTETAKIDYIHDKNPKLPPFTVLNQVHHTGTIVYLPDPNTIHSHSLAAIEEEKLRLTMSGLQQLQDSANHTPTHYFTLNSKQVDGIFAALEKFKNLFKSKKKKYYGVDKDVVTVSQKAADKIRDNGNRYKPGIFVSNFCLNEFRLFFNDARPGIKHLENHIKYFNQCLDESEALWNEKASPELCEQIQLFRNIYLQYFGFAGKGNRLEKITAKISRLQRRLADITDKRVANMEEITLINLLLTIKNRIIDLNKEKIIPYARGKTVLYVGCASGDNRTGILLNHLAAQSMGIINNDGYMQKFFKAGHIYELTGALDGTNGIRKKSIGSIPDYPLVNGEELRKHLISKTSNMKDLRKPSQRRHSLTKNEKLECKNSNGQPLITDQIDAEVLAAENNEAEKIKLKLMQKVNDSNNLFSPAKDNNNPFIALEKTITHYLSPASPRYSQPSAKYYNAVVDYYLELQKKDCHYKNELSNSRSTHSHAIEKNKQLKGERRDLRILARNFNAVLNTLHEKGSIEKKSIILNKFKETIPKESATDKLANFLRTAIMEFIPTLPAFFKPYCNKVERDQRIAGNFDKLTRNLDREYQRQRVHLPKLH